MVKQLPKVSITGAEVKFSLAMSSMPWLLDKEKKSRKSGALSLKLFKELPPRLPALLFAYDVYKRAIKAELESDGEWDDETAKEFSEGLDEELAGRTLFQLVGACRRSGIDPESALRRFASRQVSLLEPSLPEESSDAE